MKKSRIFITGLAVLALIGIPGVASANSGHGQELRPASVQYVAGGATATKPIYEWMSGLVTYHCVYNGWAQVKVNYSCNLQTLDGTLLSSHTGSFTNGQKTTATFSFLKSGSTTLCAVAQGAYADGSDSDSHSKCN